MEWWNSGMMGRQSRNGGIVEYWNNGQRHSTQHDVVLPHFSSLGFSQYSIIPIFHHSVLKGVL
jgi:hypothetical protein